MISRREIASSIDRANVLFERCWSTLDPRDIPTPSELIAMQSQLCEAQWILDHRYRAIARERERLIARKGGYKPSWFRRRMAQLDSYARAVVSASGIGKAIGDGFAWLFYQDHPSLVEQHLRQPRQNHMPPRVGAIGERAVFEKVPILSNHLVLYHGITSYLRLGDVSFISLENAKVASLGELKTKEIGEHEYQVTLACLEADGFNLPRIKPTTLPSVPSPKLNRMPAKFQDRLTRQVTRMRKALEASKKSEQAVRFNLKGQMFFEELNQVIGESRTLGFSYRKAGNSLVIGAVRVDEQKVSDRLLGSKSDINGRVDPVSDHVEPFSIPRFGTIASFFSRSDTRTVSLACCPERFLSSGGPSNGRTYLIWCLARSL